MLHLGQHLKQQLKISPQQIQYIQLLQLPTLELEQRIQSELESNPLLEEGTFAEEVIVATEPPGEDASTSQDEYDWAELLAGGDDLSGYKVKEDRSSTEYQLRELPMAARPSLVEHLRAQQAFLKLDPLEMLVADQIIGSVDEDGYMRRPVASIVDDIAFNHGQTLTEEDVERVLRHIQTLEPVGIAARNLRECLIVQLEVLPDDTPGRATAIGILEKTFDAFANRHFGRIKKKLHIDDEALKAANDLILRLDPKPGEGAFTAEQNYITPDLSVRRDGEDFLFQLNGRNAPELRISRPYRALLQQLADEKQTSDGQRSPVDKGTRKFLRERYDSAQWFIKSIHQRRLTMMKVMKAIVDLQGDFFRFGEGHLRPMILKNVAERIGMDISTVSRVVSGKYVQCDFGVYELKYFFSEGLATEDGGSISNKEVKAIIESIIDDEDKSRPLSDEAIAALLTRRGFKIARRTVSKYRTQLNIPVGRLRKQIVLS